MAVTMAKPKKRQDGDNSAQATATAGSAQFTGLRVKLKYAKPYNPASVAAHYRHF